MMMRMSLPVEVLKSKASPFWASTLTFHEKEIIECCVSTRKARRLVAPWDPQGSCVRGMGLFTLESSPDNAVQRQQSEMMPALLSMFDSSM